MRRRLASRPRRLYRRALSRPRPAPIEVIANGEDQGRETRRRTRRRRDGAHHVELIKDKLILPYLDMDLK
jgi:hypothetical protein